MSGVTAPLKTSKRKSDKMVVVHDVFNTFNKILGIVALVHLID